MDSTGGEVENSSPGTATIPTATTTMDEYHYPFHGERLRSIANCNEFLEIKSLKDKIVMKLKHVVAGSSRNYEISESTAVPKEESEILKMVVRYNNKEMAFVLERGTLRVMNFKMDSLQEQTDTNVKSILLKKETDVLPNVKIDIMEMNPVGKIMALSIGNRVHLFNVEDLEPKAQEHTLVVIGTFTTGNNTKYHKKIVWNPVNQNIIALLSDADHLFTCNFTSITAPHVLRRVSKMEIVDMSWCPSTGEKLMLITQDNIICMDIQLEQVVLTIPFPYIKPGNALVYVKGKDDNSSKTSDNWFQTSLISGVETNQGSSNPKAAGVKGGRVQFFDKLLNRNPLTAKALENLKGGLPFQLYWIEESQIILFSKKSITETPDHVWMTVVSWNPKDSNHFLYECKGEVFEHVEADCKGEIPLITCLAIKPMDILLLFASNSTIITLCRSVPGRFKSSANQLIPHWFYNLGGGALDSVSGVVSADVMFHNYFYKVDGIRRLPWPVVMFIDNTGTIRFHQVSSKNNKCVICGYGGEVNICRNPMCFEGIHEYCMGEKKQGKKKGMVSTERRGLELGLVNLTEWLYYCETHRTSENVDNLHNLQLAAQKLVADNEAKCKELVAYLTKFLPSRISSIELDPNSRTFSHLAYICSKTTLEKDKMVLKLNPQHPVTGQLFHQCKNRSDIPEFLTTLIAISKNSPDTGLDATENIYERYFKNFCTNYKLEGELQPYVNSLAATRYTKIQSAEGLEEVMDVLDGERRGHKFEGAPQDDGMRLHPLLPINEVDFRPKLMKELTVELKMARENLQKTKEMHNNVLAELKATQQQYQRNDQINKKELADLNTTLQQHENNKKTMESAIVELQQQISSLEQYKSTFEIQETEVVKLKTALQQHENNKKTMDSEIVELKKQISSLEKYKSTFEIQETEVVKLKTALQQHENNKKTMDSEIVELKKQISSLEQQLSVLHMPQSKSPEQSISKFRTLTICGQDQEEQSPSPPTIEIVETSDLDLDQCSNTPQIATTPTPDLAADEETPKDNFEEDEQDQEELPSTSTSITSNVETVEPPVLDSDLSSSSPQLATTPTPDVAADEETPKDNFEEGEQEQSTSVEVGQESRRSKRLQNKSPEKVELQRIAKKSRGIHKKRDVNGPLRKQQHSNIVEAVAQKYRPEGGKRLKKLRLHKSIQKARQFRHDKNKDQNADDEQQDTENA